MASAWFVVAILSLGACWMAGLVIRGKIWRLGFVFTAGVLCFFATAIPACLYQFSHDPSLKSVAAACLAGAGVLMTVGGALNSRGRFRGLAALMSVAVAALLVPSLRLILPPSYGVLTYVLAAITWIFIVAALNYERFFGRANSGTE
jgi:hypothetical protein